ncbi:hypothetical protein [Paracoccus hibiscisoli]|uniref:Hemolysin XhlA n=1 Tax=Paracoccus hibiscisoli TaxID=2023261 RepID=A0A4U0QUX7_9RHOB|nr:hypothetical protein [Paracoccus hibiscisoli]TJZ85806.1 hypothetical protein FA740_05245 [Paracoccus hibiscisoli]
MDARVDRLVEDMKEVKADLRSYREDMSAIKIQLARMEGKLDSKIDYKWLTVYVLGIVAVILREEIASLFS